MMRRRPLLAAPLFAAPLLACPGIRPARAQDRFPSRPIRMVIPVAVAGVTDIVGRTIADAMSPILGRPVVAENFAGAGGTLGATAFQRTPADGHSVFVGTNSLSVMKAIYPSYAYDPMTDYVPLALLTRQPFILAVNPQVPARNVPELLAWLKREKDAVNYGATNPGGSNHLAGELLRQLAGVDYTIVPYRAAAASVQDLVAGRMQVTIDTPTMLMPLIRDGLVRGLAVTTPEASALVPGLPSLQEAGIAGYDMTVWQALFARPGTPPEILATLEDAARKVVTDPAVRQRLAAVGCDIWPDSSPAAAAALLKSEIARWSPIVAAMNLGSG